MRPRSLTIALALVALASVPATTPATGATTTTATATTPATTTTTPAGSAPAPAAAKTDGKGAGIAPGAIVLLAVVGALMLLVVVLWAIARWWAWEPAWLARSRHATAEAGWRTSAAWAEFRDWLRLGR